MALCNESGVVKTENGTKTYVSLPCRAWTCDHCNPIRHKGLVKNGISGSPNTFLTLTIKRAEAPTPIIGAQKLAKAWRLLRLRIMRKHKWTKLPFIAVFEKHVSGWPHLHILLRMAYVDQRWISAIMDELIKSPIVDIRRINNRAEAVAYVAKYCGSDTEKFGTCKRYWQSQDYDLRKGKEERQRARPGEGWEREPWTIARWITAQVQLGQQVERIGMYRATSTAPPW